MEPTTNLQNQTTATASQPQTQASTAPTVAPLATVSTTNIAPPTTQSQVTPYLTDLQKAQYAVAQSEANPYFQEKTETQIKAGITDALGNVPIPQAPKLEETYTKMREEYGLKDIESNIQELTKASKELQARSRLQIQNERKQTVSMGVIGGRSTEIEQQNNEQLDFIQRQITYQTEQVQSAYKMIDTVMNLKGMDFSNSMRVYETEFQRNKTIYDMTRTQVNDQRDFKQRMIERAQDTAKANLQTYANLVIKGNVSFDRLSAAEKLDVNKMEIQAGLGIGFLSKVKMSPKDRIVTTSQRVDPKGNKYVDTILMNDDGTTKVQSVFLGKEYMGGGSGGRGGSRSSSSAATAATAAAKETDAFWKTADTSKVALRSGARWGEVWNSFKARFPSSTAGDIDRALGVPVDWIAAGKPGWEWWNEANG